MRSWLTDTLQQYPEIAVMLTLLTGFLVGRVHIKGFTLGTVTGVLLVGIVIGSFHINIPSETKSIFFLFFLFCTGYGIGPQFFQGLKKDGLPLALFSFIVCCSSLLFCWGLASLLRFETGTTAGLMSGANTCSAIIGVASNTINELDLTDQEKNTLINQIPVAYAVTYIFGTAGTSWFLSGGALIAGLVFGWMRGIHPRFGYIPAASQWVLTKLGLHVFNAIVGLSASEGFLRGLKEEGITLFLNITLTTSGVIIVLLMHKGG